MTDTEPYRPTQALNLALRAAEQQLLEATPAYWLRRADELDAARATGRSRAAVSQAARLQATATACRRHARIVQPTLDQVEEARALAGALLDAIDDDIKQTLTRLAATTSPERAQHWQDLLRSLIECRTAAALRRAALRRIPLAPPTDDDADTAAQLEESRARVDSALAPRRRLEAA